MKSLFKQIAPFILFGITVFVFILGLVVFSYVLIIGALIGVVLFIIQWIKNKLTSSKTPSPPQKSNLPGRTIDHDDL